MEEESMLTSSASAFDTKQHWRQRKQADDPLTDFTRPLILPNPFGTDPDLRRNRTDLSPKHAGKGDHSRSHGYSSHRPVRETNKSRPFQATTVKSHNESQGRITGKNSEDTRNKGFRNVRSAPTTARKSPAQTHFVPFEVKMADFPELAGDAQTKGSQKECWGPSPQTTRPQTQAQTTTWKAGARGTTTQKDSLQIATDAKATDLVNPAAQLFGTSWANIASQPPKKQPVFTDKTIKSNAIQAEKMGPPGEDGAQGKKKRKKKKKAKSNAEVESEDPRIPRDPPKFEDEEEFPGLPVPFPGTDRLITSSKTKLCNEENQREGGQHHSSDPNKEKLPAGKTQPTESANKGQKAEKVSGKKSKAPVQLDIGNMLAVLEKKQQSQKSKQDTKPVILSVGGGLPVVQKQSSAPKKLHWQQDKIAHNPLDSTSPLVKKGKQREVPKAKKPTPLKKVILKEREERKQKRLLDERGVLPENESKPFNDATEEQNEANATDDVGNLSQEFDDQLKIMGADPVFEDEEEDADKDGVIQEELTPPELHPDSLPKIHSRKFRDYCSQMLSKDLDECVTSLLKELVRFQDRLYQKDPMKARMKRRIVMGLREVLKHLKLRKVKCVIISPNCERIQSKGGLDEALHTIIDMCREQGVPFVFALSRKTLGRCVNKAVPVSLVGIFNYDGAQDYYHKMIELSSDARTAYEAKLTSLEQNDQADEDLEVEVNNLVEEPTSGSDIQLPEEPEYIKFWKKMLEKDSSHSFLNFEQQLSYMHLDSEYTENTEEKESF
uniref:SECIS binding protein 2 n=2 Tax=Iconisemion striatum TaxID=60296 RepID=A0A1A7Y0L4_9TELE